MSTIKKIGILVIITLLINIQINADNGSNFSLYTTAGFLFGHSEEIVYKNPQSTDYLSELLWDLKPHLYIGIEGAFTPANRASAGLIAFGSVKLGLPGLNGIMENRDWMNTNNNFLTHYSRHNAVSGFSILTDLSLGYSWALTQAISFQAYGEFSYMYFSWTGRDGYNQYPSTLFQPHPPWNEDIPKVNFNGRVITYEQSWFVLSPGIALNARINSMLSLGLGFSYSPLVFCFAKDEHLLRDTIFYDILSFGNYINIKGNVLLNPLENINLNFSVAYRYANGLRGNTYIRQNNQTIASGNTGGAGYSAFDFTFAIRVPVF